MDRRAVVRRRAQPDDLRADGDRLRVVVTGLVMQSDTDGHGDYSGFEELLVNCGTNIVDCTL